MHRASELLKQHERLRGTAGVALLTMTFGWNLKRKPLIASTENTAVERIMSQSIHHTVFTKSTLTWDGWEAQRSSRRCKWNAYPSEGSKILIKRRWTYLLLRYSNRGNLTFQLRCVCSTPSNRALLLSLPLWHDLDVGYVSFSAGLNLTVSRVKSLNLPR